jgi:hypothetical protein
MAMPELQTLAHSMGITRIGRTRKFHCPIARFRFLGLMTTVPD